jgi:hypothetical protein
MNKLAIILSISLLCMGCAPTPNPPIPAPAPAPIQQAIVTTTPLKAQVIDMPAAPSYPKNAIARQRPLPTAQIYPGSLKENIERIAAHYGWHHVVWDAPEDFRWVGYAQIQGENLSIILRQLLNDYPLQAVFYQGNHVLYIHPRTLK